MSYNTLFLDFFDVINSGVVNFNSSLGKLGYGEHQTRRQQSPKVKGSGNGKIRKTALKNYDRATINDWSSLPLNSKSTNIIPPVNILELEKSYEVSVSIPGVKDKNNIIVQYYKNNNEIMVCGELQSTAIEHNANNIRVMEFASGKFKRSIPLPENPRIDADNIKADYSSGILTVQIPKLEQTSPKDSVHKIEVSYEQSSKE